MRRSMAAVVLIFLLAGCAPAEYVPDSPFAMDGVVLRIEALPQQPCDPAQPYAVRVRWAVLDWADPKFDFHLRSSHGQLWARHNVAEGEQDTDAFVRPGLWFVMVDRETRQVVAAEPAPPLFCPPTTG